jgi:hypothetical protein
MDHDPLSPTGSHEPEIPENRRYMLASLSCLGVVLCVAFAATIVLAFYFLRPSFVALLSATPTPTFTNTPAPAAQIAPTSTQATASQKPDVEISVYCALMGDSPSYAEVDQPVVLTWAWGAATEAYGQDYIDAASFSVQIDGENVDVSSVAPVLSIQSNEYWATWSLPPRTFAAGTHQTILNVTLSRQVTDGLDLDLDGNLDLYGPGLSTFAPCDIIVTQARATEPPPIHDTDLPQAQWPLVLFDSFDTNDNEWLDFADLSGTEPKTFDVRDGKYVWSVQSDPGSLGVGWPFWANRSPEVSDFYASVEANATGEIKDATYGLVFRASETGHYAFGLNDQGLFTVEAIVYHQSNNILIKPTETSAVQSGASNRLSVAAIGSHLMFYINDQLVAELDDDTLQHGFVGVYINLEGGNALANVEFDNFELRAPAIATPTATTTDDSQWTVILSDAFDSNENDWRIEGLDDEYFTVNQLITDGKYRWQAKSKSGAILWWDEPESLYTKPVSDFYLSAEIQMVSGPDDATYGLLFRENDSDFYYFGINNHGEFFVRLSTRLGEYLIVPTSTPAIRPGEVNWLAVRGEGSHFVFFINDERVGEADDSTFSKGRTGIAIELNHTDDEAVFEFDNFEVRAP